VTLLAMLAPQNVAVTAGANADVAITLTKTCRTPEVEITARPPVPERLFVCRHQNRHGPQRHSAAVSVVTKELLDDRQPTASATW
jgi:hypothetical protein